MVKSFFEPIEEEVMFRVNPPVKAMIVLEAETEIVPDTLGVPGRAMIINEPIIENSAPPTPRAVVVEGGVGELVDPAPRAIPVEEEIELPQLRPLPPIIQRPAENPARAIIIQE
jgi:hypothetical protein